jgi:hypothetical protein
VAGSANKMQCIVGVLGCHASILVMVLHSMETRRSLKGYGPKSPAVEARVLAEDGRE